MIDERFLRHMTQEKFREFVRSTKNPYMDETMAVEATRNEQSASSGSDSSDCSHCASKDAESRVDAACAATHDKTRDLLAPATPKHLAYPLGFGNRIETTTLDKVTCHLCGDTHETLTEFGDVLGVGVTVTATRTGTTVSHIDLCVNCARALGDMLNETHSAGVLYEATDYFGELRDLLDEDVDG